MVRILPVPLLALLVTFAPPANAQRSAYEEARALQRHSITAYESGDLDTFVALTRQALALRPNHPALLYNLAAGLARSGASDAASSLLLRIARLGLTFDPNSDPDFAALRGLPTFEAAMDSLAANDAPLVRSDTAFTLPESAGIPESVALLTTDSTYLVTSVFDRAIYRKRGPYVDKLIDLDAASFDECPCHGGLPPGSPPQSESDRASTFIALAYDANRDILWATRSPLAALREAGGPTQEATATSIGLPPPALVRVGYESGTVLETHALMGSTDAFLGDLAVGPDGSVYLSETNAGALHVLRPHAGGLSVLVAPGTLVSPQGIAPHPDGEVVFVADYAAGVFRLDARTGRVLPFDVPEEVILLGIDGLHWYEESLIAVQNGTRPQRVLRLTLSEDASRIEQATVLEANHPAYPEPTTGVVVGDAFVYVANSNWRVLDEPDRTSIHPPVILRLPLSR